ncbi:MAG: AAA-like domain-containing protein [Capsulimonadales bacterium]|nr:AAA-like domain-containing protein [Capsulimonadales bacterium]
MSNLESEFFVTGGTVPPDAPSYVERQADRDLLEGLMAGEYCYVLNTRQMGKSSLSARTILRLQERGVSTVFLDLTRFGGQNVTAEQWYLGLLSETGRSLGLRKEFLAYAKENAAYSPLERYFGALEHVALPRIETSLVIFVDEIDAIRSLPFPTDEFFAAIRECFNRRVRDPLFHRLTFCLLGVATPADLISDTRISPFNVGRRIRLRDFTAEEAAPLAQGMVGGRASLNRVLYWTGGHPYLTQRLCRTVVEEGSDGTAADIDRICRALFLIKSARESDDNLSFVRNRLIRSDVDLASLLDRYRKIRGGRRITDDETDPLCAVLRLSGVVKVNPSNHLVLRNRIYDRVFDDDWVEAHLPDAELRRQREAYRRGVLRATTIAGFMTAIFGILSFIAIGKANEASLERSNARRSELQANLLADQAKKEADRANEEARRANDEAQRASRLATQARLQADRANQGERAARMAKASAERAASAEKVAKQNAIVLASSLENALREANARRRDAILARENETVARRQGEQFLYDANVQLAANYWESERHGVRGVRDLLLTLVPKGNAGTDRREFAWKALWTRLTHGEAVMRLAPLFPDNQAVAQDTDRRLPTVVEYGAGGSENGDFEVARLDSAGRVYDANGGAPGIDLRLRFPNLRRAAVSRNGRSLAVAEKNGRLSLLDASTGRTHWERKDLRYPVTHLMFQQGDRTVLSLEDAGGKDGGEVRTVRVHDTATGEDVTPDYLRAPDFLQAFNHAAGRLMAVSENGRFFAFQVTTGRVLLLDANRSGGAMYSRIELDSLSPLLSAAFSLEERRLVTGDSTGRVVVLKLLPGSTFETQEVARFQATSAGISYCQFAPAGATVAVGSTDGTVVLWDISSGRKLRTFKGHVASINYLRFEDRADRLWTGDESGEIRCWALPDRDSSGFLVANPSAFRDLAVSPDGRSLLIADSETVLLRDAVTGRRLRNFSAPTMITAGAFSPDGLRVALANDQAQVSLFRVADGAHLKTFRCRESGAYRRDIGRLVFSPDGKTLAIGFGQSLWSLGDGRGVAQIRDSTSGKLLTEWKGFGNATPAVAFSPDGRTLAVGSFDRTVSLFDVASGRRRAIRNVSGAVAGVSFSADGQRIGVAHDRFVDIYPVSEPGGLLRRLTGHSDSVHDLAFSPDGKTLASASWDQTTKLWDMRTGRELATLNGHTDRVHRVVFDRSGQRLYTAQLNGAVRVWEAGDPGTAARLARLRAFAQEAAWKRAEEEANQFEEAKKWHDAAMTLSRLIRDMGDVAPPGLTRRWLIARAQAGEVSLEKEELDPAGWDWYRAADGIAQMTRLPGDIFRIETRKGAKDPWDVQLLQKGLTLAPGSVYALQFRMRVEGVSSLPVIVQVQKDNGDYGAIGLTQFPIATGEWKLFRFIFTAQDNSPAGHGSLVFMVGRQSNTAFFSDVSLRKVAEPR